MRYKFKQLYHPTVIIEEKYVIYNRVYFFNTTVNIPLFKKFDICIYTASRYIQP